MRVVKIEDMTGNAVEQGGVEDVEPLGIALLRLCQGRFSQGSTGFNERSSKRWRTAGDPEKGIPRYPRSVMSSIWSKITRALRGDATLLAQRLLGHAVPSAWTVNLSGCEKQCARRHGAAAELVAGLSGYTLNIAGRRVASDCSRESVLDAVAALHENLLSETAQ